MKSRFACGLVVILALSICLPARQVRANATDDSDYHYDDEYDDEYDDSYDDDDNHQDQSPLDRDKLSAASSSTSSPVGSSSTTSASTSTTTTAAPLWSDEDDVREDYPCPRNCSCEDGTKFVNCSFKSLVEIPTDLPKNVIRLDLSGNNIKHIPVEAFQNCTDVREILLDRNVIEELDKEVFMNLGHLDVVTLAGNQIGHLESDTFSEAQSLRRLVLSENPLVIPDDGPLLQQDELEELELARCNFTELTTQAFTGLEGLKSLNLAGNEFDEDLSTDVFEPLVNLQRLHLPPLSEDTVRDLCDVIKSIDVVDITTHNISCFYLASETSYEESIITQRPIKPEPKIDEEEEEEVKELEHSDSQSGVTTVKPGKKTLKNNNEIEDDEDIKTTTVRVRPTHPTRRSSTTTITTTTTTTTTEASPTVSGPSSASITHSADSGIGEGVKKNSTAPEGEKNLLASLSSETMRQLLMGIIGVALLILLIGIICRQTGLKNRLCGSKRRPAPTDQVRPAEEVPLNKV